MSRNIKITEKQYKKIQEDIDNEFIYFSDNDSKNCDGQLNITADGKIDNETYGNPTTADKIQQTLTPQNYDRYRSYGNIYPRSMREGIDINKDKNNDGVDDFYNHEELDILSNGKEDDNLTKIPTSIDNKTQILVDAIKNNSLKPKQQAMVLNKLIEVLDLSSIPYSWKKELMLKLKSNNINNSQTNAIH